MRRFVRGYFHIEVNIAVCAQAGEGRHLAATCVPFFSLIFYRGTCWGVGGAAAGGGGCASV